MIRRALVRGGAGLVLLIVLIRGTTADESRPEKEGGKRPPGGGEEGGAGEKEAPPPLRLEKLSDSCHLAVRRDGRSNAGFVVGKEAVLVVDCLDSRARAEELLRAIRRVTAKPVRRIVLTHWHYDHSVGNQAFPKEVEILAADGSASALARRIEADRLLLGPGSGAHGTVEIGKVRQVSEGLRKDREVDLGGLTVQVKILGEGHSAGDAAVYVPSEKVLFAGDLVWSGYHPNISGGSTFRWIAAIARLERLEIEKVAPGHGKPGDAALLEEQRRYLMNVRRLVKHLAKNKVDPERILEGLEIPAPYRELGNAAWWKGNIRYIYQEIVGGR